MASPLPLLILSAADPDSEVGRPFPKGMTFNPSDEDLIFYLYKKILGLPFHPGLIFESDLYGEKNPRLICEEIKTLYPYTNSISEDLYFFTHLKKKGRSQSRIDRKAGSGFWEGEDSGKKVLSMVDPNSRTTRCIGTKKRFRFEKSKTREDGAWIMHEYSLEPSLLPSHLPPTDFVLCRVRKNNFKRKCSGNNLERGAQDKTPCLSLVPSTPRATELHPLSPLNTEVSNPFPNVEEVQLVPDNHIMCLDCQPVQISNLKRNCSDGAELGVQDMVPFSPLIACTPLTPDTVLSYCPLDTEVEVSNSEEVQLVQENRMCPDFESIILYDPSSPSDATFPASTSHTTSSQVYSHDAGFELNSQDASDELLCLFSDYNNYSINIDDFF